MPAEESQQLVYLEWPVRYYPGGGVPNFAGFRRRDPPVVLFFCYLSFFAN
jgi:hypothetical protein